MSASIVTRVEKLLRLAGHRATPTEEARTAAVAAAQLYCEHGLSVQAKLADAPRGPSYHSWRAGETQWDTRGWDDFTHYRTRPWSPPPATPPPPPPPPFREPKRPTRIRLDVGGFPCCWCGIGTAEGDEVDFIRSRGIAHPGECSKRAFG